MWTQMYSRNSRNTLANASEFVYNVSWSVYVIVSNTVNMYLPLSRNPEAITSRIWESRRYNRCECCHISYSFSKILRQSALKRVKWNHMISRIKCFDIKKSPKMSNRKYANNVCGSTHYVGSTLCGVNTMLISCPPHCGGGHFNHDVLWKA